MTTKLRLSNEDLKHLLPQCINRDEAAWETVFHGLYGLVKCVVIKSLRERANDDEVEDAVADAFRNIVDAVAEVTEAQNPIGYIGAIARNAALARARRVSMVAGHEVSWMVNDDSGGSDGEMILPPESADQPTQGLDIMTRQIEKELERLKRTLPEEDRTLLRLKYALDLTYDEVAYIVGKESGALRVAIHRIVKGLRAALNEDIREAVVNDPRLFGQLVGMNLKTPEAGDAVVELNERMQHLLEDYVDDEQTMQPADREEVEVALLTSAGLRERKVMLARQLNEVELDVMGHCAELPSMPEPMLKNLLSHALTAPRPEI